VVVVVVVVTVVTAATAVVVVVIALAGRMTREQSSSMENLWQSSQTVEKLR